ncbi:MULTISPECIES: putative quinol monooxygenase [Rhizobium]|jgi:quinol monooxygenase YgiN|uniref:putative quinol monooxygenase n=1 Tax=Rhizobium TaxID=379 RepID=UPI001854DE82|nr:putative quinol monooxygenase [Rhizobium leguminosarum]MBA8830297.1 quinol monooxygenase YgiN [Rhizobium leguminosarum]
MVELTVAPGNTDAFGHAFAVQAAAVRVSEPGNRLYKLFKSRTLADSYTLIEIYEDEAALAAHHTSSHMAANRPLTAPFLATPPVMHVFTVALPAMVGIRR